MLNSKVFIYRESDGSYSCCIDDNSALPYGLTGEGATAQQAIEDWYRHYLGMREYFNANNKEFVESEFSFAFDVPSMLSYYAGRLTFAGLSKITGVSAAQLSQYASGYRNPTAKTVKKIQDGLHEFASELNQIVLV